MSVTVSFVATNRNVFFSSGMWSHFFIRQARRKCGLVQATSKRPSSKQEMVQLLTGFWCGMKAPSEPRLIKTGTTGKTSEKKNNWNLTPEKKSLGSGIKSRDGQATGTTNIFYLGLSCNDVNNARERNSVLKKKCFDTYAEQQISCVSAYFTHTVKAKTQLFSKLCVSRMLDIFSSPEPKAHR